MPVTIRSRLLLLVLAVLLPGMLGVGWLISSTYEAERDAHQRTLRDTSRALSMLIDGELSRRATIAHVLSQSPVLDGSDLQNPEQRQGFEELARRAMQGMDGWVELRAPGRVLLSTRLPEGASAETAGPALSAVAQMQPLGPVATGTAGEPQDLHAAWVEPVLRNGQLLYNLVVTVRPSELQRIVEAQAPHSGWIGTVMDSAGHVVARQPGGAAYIGRERRPDLRAAMAGAREGAFESMSLDGVPTAGYFSTSPLGWSFVAAMPRQEFTGRLPQAVQRIAIGALALLALSMAGAVWVSRRIERPIRALKSAAEDLQAGRPVQAAPTGMVECDEVAAALASAGRTQAGARAELEQSVAQAVERTRMVEQRGAQSQRVEALGRLTGGVAHEFNNLLGIISNSMHLMRRHAAAADLQAPLNATQRSVDRGSQLTQHLLRFAGRRTTMREQTVQLGRYLPEVQELMRSVLGRRIEIHVQVAPNVWPVRVDASELDLALVNLALNAHDAMPNGGELRLRACNASAEDKEGLPPGDYVLLTVGDDGVGMAPAQVEHAFEPFFTTKSVGEGSGLGLSQVHGFATQAGGTARLASTPGLGTTVSLLLPVAGGADERPAQSAGEATQLSIAGSTVMLVEDDEALGDVTAALLMAHGAKVLRAGQVDTALRLLDAGITPDVVLSDVVMPGRLDGVALARRLREQRPGLPIVLITGFSNTASLAEDEFVVLRKPCAPAEMLAMLQTAMAGARAAAPPAGTLAGHRP
ncbi:MAG: response regulator [Burkholderiales bacterium]|jgi:signal transduction histidine kinase/ActR/RegA family two-component response regulator|nr:response regulator [Burkholderiales bacterium]